MAIHARSNRVYPWWDCCPCLFMGIHRKGFRILTKTKLKNYSFLLMNRSTWLNTNFVDIIHGKHYNVEMF